MISLSIKVDVPDLSRVWRELPCPNCSITTRVQFKDILGGKVVVCKGCKSNIRLVDSQNSVKRSLRRLQNQIESLGLKN